MSETAVTFNDTLILGSAARSAFATLCYGLLSGDTEIVGMAHNQIQDLKDAYVDAFWGGEF